MKHVLAAQVHPAAVAHIASVLGAAEVARVHSTLLVAHPVPTHRSLLGDLSDRESSVANAHSPDNKRDNGSVESVLFQAEEAT